MASDAANGAVLAWVDNRAGTSFPDIYTQRVRAGSPYFTCWTSNGVLVASGVLPDPGLSVAGDGAGGAGMAFSTNDISARHVKNSGALDPIFSLCFAGGVQNFTSTAVTTATEAIVSWWDGRNSLQGVYANQHPVGAPGSDPCPPVVNVSDDLSTLTRVELLPPSPNPTGKDVVFRYGVPAELAGQRFEVGIFDLSGRRVRLVESGTSRAGRSSTSWDLRDDSGRSVNAGLFYARVRIGDTEQTRRVLVRR